MSEILKGNFKPQKPVDGEAARVITACRASTPAADARVKVRP